MSAPLPVPTSSNPPGVVLLPEHSPARGRVAEGISQASGLLLPRLMASRADVAIVDLTCDGGPAALAELLAESRGPAILALVDWSRPEQLEAASWAGVSDLLAREAAPAELATRLRQARERRAAQVESLRRQKDLRLLLELTADYAASFDVEELLHAMTRRLAEEMDILRASLVVLDEHGAAVVVAASDDPTLRDHPLDLQRYPEIREVVRTGQPVILEDAPSHPLLEGVQGHVAARGIHAIAALPLTLQGKVLGVLLLRAGASRASFDAHEIDLLATVAHATAVALRNARRVESIRGQTEREKSARLAAEERAAQLERYQSFFAHVSDGIAILDEKAGVLSLNPAGAQLLEVSAQDARGQHFHQLAHPSDEGLLLAALVAVRDGKTQRDLDLPVRTRGGRKLVLSLSAAPLEEGVGAAILSFRDVTVQRSLEADLRSTTDFLERLIDSSVDAIIASDMTGKVILFNKGAEAICGWTAAEAIEKLDVRALYPPGVARRVMQRLRSPEHGGKGRLNVTREEILTKAGEKIPVNMTASILYEGDRESATVGIFTDLRDRVQLERKLSDAEIRLEEGERNAVIVALAGTAAHELNQPLTSVMGYAELLKRKLSSDDFALRPVEIIYREAERMAEIVRKIGKITRYETKAYVGTKQIVDLDKASSHEE